jgi:hypothetical protein
MVSKEAVERALLIQGRNNGAYLTNDDA